MGGGGERVCAVHQMRGNSPECETVAAAAVATLYKGWLGGWLVCVCKCEKLCPSPAHEHLRTGVHLYT